MPATKNLRMVLNFGHTFAHAIEVKNNYSKMITHGEAVLSGMILALRISLIKRACKAETVDEIKEIYKNSIFHHWNCCFCLNQPSIT